MSISYRRESLIVRIILVLGGFVIVLQGLRRIQRRDAIYPADLAKRIITNPKWTTMPSAGLEAETLAVGVGIDSETTTIIFPEQFPNRLWQTSSQGFSKLNEEDKELLQTWLDKNPTWRYESITQDTSAAYVKYSYSNEPEIVKLFTTLTDPILRADFIRYLVLLKDGGVYSDSDTLNLKPIDTWIPEEYRAKTNVVIGVEYDILKGPRWLDWTLNLQFTTWTIMTKPSHPLFRLVVDHVATGLQALAAQQNTTISSLRTTFSQVLDTTGPARFSRTVFQYLNHSDRLFSWENVTGLKEPMLVDDVLILPITAFGCGQAHSAAGLPTDEGALVQHMFHGSWKGEHNLQDEIRMKDEAEGQRMLGMEEEEMSTIDGEEKHESEGQ